MAAYTPQALLDQRRRIGIPVLYGDFTTKKGRVEAPKSSPQIPRRNRRLKSDYGG